MRLISREFIRSLRSHALLVLRQDPNTWKDYKRQRRWFDVPFVRSTVLYTLWLTLWFAGFTFQAVNKKDFSEVVIALYCSGTFILRSTSFRARLHTHDANVLRGFPVSDRDFFALQWRRHLLRSLWVVAATTFVYLVLSISSGRPIAFAVIASLLAGLLQWL